MLLWQVINVAYWPLVNSRCGKLLKSEMDAQAHAARTQHDSFSESTEEIKPLTDEEKKEQLEKWVVAIQTQCTCILSDCTGRF